MPCHYPVSCYRLADKSGNSDRIVFALVKGMNVVSEFKIPCGQCVGCKTERARQWAVRCVHEASLWKSNSVVTLTYNDAHIPDGNCLDYSHFQLFMKRLRKKFCHYLPKKGMSGPYRTVRFFMCGEYGDSFGRPHFHAALFNVFFDDRVYFKTTPAGTRLYTSKTLDGLWCDRNDVSFGFATVGDLDARSAGYIARYTMKKRFGHGSDEFYKYTDVETGEVLEKDKEFVRMSLKPGIGSGFYSKWFNDIYPHDLVVVNGVAQKPPRYYSLKLKQDNSDLHEELLYKREQKVRDHINDNTQERLEVKEEVLIARIRNCKRELI